STSRVGGRLVWGSRSSNRIPREAARAHYAEIRMSTNCSISIHHLRDVGGRTGKSPSIRVVVDVGGATEPVVGAVDLPRNGGVARVLGPNDPVALELVHDSAGAVEAQLQLGLQHGRARLARGDDQLGGARRRLVLGHLREPTELAAATFAIV